MKQITKDVRYVVMNMTSKSGLKTAVQEYFKNPNQFMESEKDHINLVGIRWANKLDNFGGWRGRLISIFVQNAATEVEWHLIIDSKGNFIDERNIPILEIHCE